MSAYDFVLAQRLGMTVGELGERMSSDEFVRWQAFDAVVAAKQKAEARKGRNRGG